MKALYIAQRENDNGNESLIRNEPEILHELSIAKNGKIIGEHVLPLFDPIPLIGFIINLVIRSSSVRSGSLTNLAPWQIHERSFYVFHSIGSTFGLTDCRLGKSSDQTLVLQRLTDGNFEGVLITGTPSFY